MSHYHSTEFHTTRCPPRYKSKKENTYSYGTDFWKTNYRVQLNLLAYADRCGPAAILEAGAKKNIPKDLLLIVIGYWEDLQDQDAIILNIQHGLYTRMIRHFYDLWKYTCICNECKPKNLKHRALFNRLEENARTRYYSTI